MLSPRAKTPATTCLSSPAPTVSTVRVTHPHLGPPNNTSPMTLTPPVITRHHCRTSRPSVEHPHHQQTTPSAPSHSPIQNALSNRPADSPAQLSKSPVPSAAICAYSIPNTASHPEGTRALRPIPDSGSVRGHYISAMFSAWYETSTTCRILCRQHRHSGPHFSPPSQMSHTPSCASRPSVSLLSENGLQIRIQARACQG